VGCLTDAMASQVMTLDTADVLVLHVGEEHLRPVLHSMQVCSSAAHLAVNGHGGKGGGGVGRPRHIAHCHTQIPVQDGLPNCKTDLCVRVTSTCASIQRTADGEIWTQERQLPATMHVAAVNDQTLYRKACWSRSER
jgi:hypothetical protein